ncbi:hypothetical protein ALI144C_32160 [Actinosynnema sp. ALI-1.44]|nr:hypothetical protein ALI144C_32160 [Actinosynnema sp. ALI-1.44]
MINSPYTRMIGDDLHGWHARVTPAWVRLDALYLRNPNTPIRTVGDGLDLSGEVRGHVSGWWRTVKGDWLGVVNFAVPYADGRRDRLELQDQLVPGYALRKRDDSRPH